MIDPTKTKPGDRVRLVTVTGEELKAGFRVGDVVVVTEVDDDYFRVTIPDNKLHWNKLRWFYRSQAEPIEPKEPKPSTFTPEQLAELDAWYVKNKAEDASPSLTSVRSVSNDTIEAVYSDGHSKYYTFDHSKSEWFETQELRGGQDG